MPILVRNSNIEDVQRGRGVERCYFSAYGYTAPQKPLPETISADYIRTQPGTLPSLRTIARFALLDTVKPDITNSDTASKIMNTLKQSSIMGVGDMNIERTDTDRTTNYIVPLNSDKGIIEIVINAAWGCSWRLGSDHELASLYPSLTVCQPEDTSRGLGEEAVGNKVSWRKPKYYISPETLEATTKEHMNPQILAERIRAYVENLLKTKEIEKEKSSMSRDNDYFGETTTQRFSLQTSYSSSKAPYFGISFELGNEEGIKSLNVFGYSNKDKPHYLDTLSQERRDIGGLIQSFYLPSSFENKHKTL